MAKVVELAVNGRGYEIACADGQEDSLRALGRELDRRVNELVEAMGQVGEARLLVMAALLIADELAEARAQVQKAPAGTIAGVTRPLADTAKRLEAIAARLQQA